MVELELMSMTKSKRSEGMVSVGSEFGLVLVDDAEVLLPMYTLPEGARVLCLGSEDRSSGDTQSASDHGIRSSGRG